MASTSKGSENKFNTCREREDNLEVPVLKDETRIVSENVENSRVTCPNDTITIVPYTSELQMPAIMRLIKEDLSEPYSIYTYRYFIYNWPYLCWMVRRCDYLIFKRTYWLVVRESQ